MEISQFLHMSTCIFVIIYACFIMVTVYKKIFSSANEWALYKSNLSTGAQLVIELFIAAAIGLLVGLLVGI